MADVNIVVYLLTDCPQRSLAVKLREIDPNWWLPTLWQHEFLNVLATLARQDYITQSDAHQLWENGLKLFGHREQAPDVRRALDLALRHGISAYDAQYLTLAESLRVRLVTEDRKLQRLFPQRAFPLANTVGDS